VSVDKLRLVVLAFLLMPPTEPAVIEQRIALPKRATILPKRGVKQPGISWQTWLLLVVALVAGSALFYFTYGLVVRPPLRWTVSVLWVVLTLALGLYDYAFPTMGSGKNIDTTPFDRWTVAHAGAGLAFGVWYLPLWVAVVLTVAWEIFEMKVVGFGDKESLFNRAVDVGIALFGWLLIVVVAMSTAFVSPPFPYLGSVAR
jgi:hypothetical protein